MSLKPFWRPSRRQVLIVGGLASGALGAGLGVGMFGDGAARAGLSAGERRGIAFGTIVSLKAVHADAGVLDRALDAAWAEIAVVEKAASLFNPESALSRLNRDGTLDNPPDALFALLAAALETAQITDGAFDPTVQPLWGLYAKAFAEGRDVREDDLEAVRPLVGWRGIELDRAHVRFAKPGMAVTLNGIAQGFATERCLAALGAHGVEDAFLNTGEVGISGKRDDRSDWQAAIADPRSKDGTILLKRPLSGILATSGDYATAWSADYARHHILDPKSLRSPALTASVSVISSSGTLADALSTAMMVMGPERSLALAVRLSGVEVLIITKSGERHMTPGFPVA